MFSKAKVRRCFSSISRFRLALMLTLCLTGAAVALLIPKSNAASPPAFGPTLLHFNGNAPEDSGCTGVGAVDATGPSANNCATLTATASLSSGPAAKWVAVAGTNQAADRNQVDPNWLWNLSGPTTLSGPMTINWWQACNAECVALGGAWRVRLWADGVQVFTQDNIPATPATPDVPSLLTTTVNLPKVTANTKFVIHIDTQFSDTGQGATIFYDSSLPCPGSTTGPCDSTVTMPVVDPNASPTPTPAATATPTPMPPGPGTPRFQVYVPTSSFSGGEPSIGTNWQTGNAMYLANFSPVRIGFDDATSPARDTWTNTSIPSAASLDPILFTDHMLPPGIPNRTFVSQLTGQDSITFYTDDDGRNYSPSQGGGIPSGVDHQTIGAGPYKPNTTPAASPSTSYPNAVYYCSQEAATAFCARSDDGGKTFGPGIPIYELLQCTGIHGHVKVATDGSVYVPNRSCGSKAAAAVSNDNGITWTVRPNPSSSTTGFLVDPSVGIGLNNVGKPTGQANNTIYLGYQASDGHPRIAVSHDQGNSWVNDQDVGTLFGIQNSTFPEVVAGDDNRAAYAFLGTTVVGDYTNQATYNQSAPWHLYIATTFDGGATWTTTDATPNDPVQRGSICNLGTTSCNGHNPNDRNLLDFMDATVDAQGRVLVGYPDGCVGSCVTKPSGIHPNSYTSRASIARQSGGRRLFAAFDPTEPNLPAAPRAKAEISSAGGPTIVSWPATDDAGAPISSYKVYRRDGTGGSFSLLATVSGTSFSDTSFTAPATSNAYRVTAVNAFGEGPYSGEAIPVVVTFESSCVYPYITVGSEGIAGTVPTDPTGGELTIQRLNVGEPFASCDDNSLTFIMKVNTLDPQNTGTAVLPPNSDWQILFGITDTDGNAQRAYVAVDTFSPNTPATPRISIGRRDPTATGTLDSRVCTNDLTNKCPAISASYNRDGTIVFKLNLATPISFGAPGTGATGIPFTWDGRVAGTTIGAAQVITGTTYVLAGAGAGLLESVQTTSGEEYTRTGNTACATGVPNAGVTANPTSGALPLTVNFDASASSVPQSCNTIASYALDFGDGSTGVQSSPAFSHTYNNAGDYTARLTVTDSAGRTSTNGAQVVIHVTSAPPTPTPTPALPPAPQDPGPKVGFQNFEAPPTLVSVTSSSQGPSAKTVEYLGHDAGEPSIGNNWKTGTTIYQSDLQTLFVTFNDNCPSGSPATWVNRPAPTSQFVDSDPIGFTDRYTGRTFAGELTLASPTCKTSFTDDDGQTWIPTQGSGLGASVDHQTIGGGPFHAPLTRPTSVPGVYPDAIYYCSQLPHEACARSDDGGATYGPIVEVDPVADAHCGGLHGHIKVAPDGTVYLPFNYCDGQGATIVSQDNGVTWTIQHVPNTASGQSDPAVGIDNNGRAYFAMSSATGNGSQAVVATSDNGGQTWQNVYDVGAVYGLKNIAYPAAVAADPGRAAVAFYGTTTAGDLSANGFRGLWHLYVAETFDGGQSWTTTDATPNAPMQRGCIWTGGGANICRNLLDFFDVTVDREGRVEVGYVNGCTGGNCAQASSTATGNAYTATATIARQSSGRRLVAAFDPLNAMNAKSAPGMPSVTTRRVGNVVHLAWSEADTGNSAILNYKIMRATASGAETLLTTVTGSQTAYDDTTATDTSKTYYYKVLASNGVGTSCAANEVAAPYVGDTCGGLILQRNDPSHPESLLAGQNPSLAIDYIAAAEPPGTNNLMFRMKVSSLASVPANSRWRIVWNSETAPGQQWYVGMRSDAGSNVSFDYGNIATAVVGLVIGVPTETSRGAINGAFAADGTITMFVPKTLVGNPQPGDLLGAVNGRTFTGDTPQTNTLQRSTLLIDHTFVKAQRDNGAPAATYTIAGNVDCSPLIEQNVNSLVSLQTSNPGSAAGISSFNLTMKNTSTQTIFTPLSVEVAQLTSASGKVKVNNADNSQVSAGANWDYSSSVGIDNILSAGEVSGARTLKFSNPNNEAFTVTFNVIGNLARASGAGSSSSPSGSGGLAGPSGSTSATTTVTNMVFSVTYNPVLNTLTWQVIKT